MFKLSYTIRLMERRPITKLDLDVFNPKTGQDQVTAAAAKNGLLPDTLSVHALAEASRAKPPEYFLSERGERLQNKVNEDVYQAMERIYDLKGKENPETFWQRQWAIGKKQVETLVHGLMPDAKNRFGFLEPVKSPTPAEVIQLLASPDTDPRTRFELTRQVGLALISAELEARSHKVERHLKKVSGWLAIDLFNQCADEDKIVLAMHDNTTNEAVWISTVPQGRGDPENAPNTHLKIHHQRMRFAGPDIQWVLMDTRKKEEGVNKTVRKALLRKAQGETDTLAPLIDVPDMMGMQFVVENEKHYTGENVQKLKSRVIEILKKHFKLSDDKFQDKPNTNGDRFKSGKFQGDRVMVTFPGIDMPLELMFHGQGDVLHNDYELGDQTDPKTGKPNGAAHAIMEAERGFAVLMHLFPEAVYGKTDWNTLEKENYEAIIRRLKEAHRVK